MPQYRRSAQPTSSLVSLSALSRDQLFDRGLTILENQMRQVFEILSFPYESCSAQEDRSTLSPVRSSPKRESESRLPSRRAGISATIPATSSRHPSSSSQTPIQAKDEAAFQLRHQQPSQGSHADSNARGKNYNAQSARRKRLSGSSASSRKRSQMGAPR